MADEHNLNDRIVRYLVHHNRWPDMHPFWWSAVWIMVAGYCFLFAQLKTSPYSYFISIYMGLGVIVAAWIGLRNMQQENAAHKRRKYFNIKPASTWKYPNLGKGLLLACLRKGLSPYKTYKKNDPGTENPHADTAETLICYGSLRELVDLEMNPYGLAEPHITRTVTYLHKISPGLFTPSFFVLMFLSAMIADLIPISKHVAMGIFLALVITVRFVHLQPLYYRVIPGRLDVLEGNLFSDRLRLHQSIDLRGAAVTCRFDADTLKITRPDHSGLLIHLGALERPHAFARAVFQAALSDRPTPEMPNHTLLG